MEKGEIKDENGNPVKGFFRLVEKREAELPDNVKDVVDSVLDEYGNLPDQELNRVVTELPEYRERMEK